MTTTHTLILLFLTMRPLIKQIPKRPCLRPVCEFTTANHRDGAANDRIRGGKMGANGKMQYNPSWESGSMKTLAAHGLAGGIVQDRMGGSFGAGFLAPWAALALPVAM
jgi:hypothetical protein